MKKKNFRNIHKLVAILCIVSVILTAIPFNGLSAQVYAEATGNGTGEGEPETTLNGNDNKESVDGNSSQEQNAQNEGNENQGGSTSENVNQGSGTGENENQGGSTGETQNQGGSTEGNENQGGSTSENENQSGNTEGNENQGGSTSENENQSGSTNGNENQGGSTSENENQSGSTEGNENQGGSTSGNENQGGSTSGNENQGGSTSGNENQGGSTSGNENQGGSTSGNENQGGSTSGNENQGGSTSGNENQGGSTSGNENQGGDTPADNPAPVSYDIVVTPKWEGDLEAGNQMAISLNAQPSATEGAYIVKVKEPGSSAAVTVEATGTEYILAEKAKAGTYSVIVDFDAVDDRADKHIEKSFKVIGTVTIKPVEGKLISKVSDGTNDLVFKEGDKAGNYFTFEGIPEGLTINVDTSNWTYKAVLPETPGNTKVKIENINKADFSFEGTDQECYKVGEAPDTVDGEITPAAVNAIDLTTGDTEFTLAEGASIEFQFPENGYVNGWINKNDVDDEYNVNKTFTLKEEQKTLSDGSTKTIRPEIVSADTVLAESNAGPSYVLTDGKEVTAEGLYILRDDIIYGPVSIKYNRDTEAPAFGQVELTVDTFFSWLLNDSNNARPGVDYEISEDLAIVASKKDIAVKVIAPEEKEGFSADAYVYLSDEKLSQEDMAAIKDTVFIENGQSGTIEDHSRKYVYVRTIDQAGNVTTGIVTGAILKDNNPPTIVSFEVSENGSTVTVKVRDGEDGTENTESGIKGIKLETYNWKKGKKESGYVQIADEYVDFDKYAGNNNGTKTHTFTVSEYGLRLKVKVIAEDYAGNTTSVMSEEFKHLDSYSVNFAFDPEAKDKPYTDGKYYYQTRTMTVSSETGFPDDSFSFNINDTKYTWDQMEYENRAYQHDEFSYPFEDGEYTVTTDSMENLDVIGLGDGNKSFIVDGKEPVVSVSLNDEIANKVEVDDKSYYYYGLSDGKTNDDANHETAVFTVTITETYFDEELAHVLINDEELQAVEWTIDDAGNHVATVEIKEEGAFDLSAYCTDPAGNESEVKTATAVIDYKNPVVTLQGEGDETPLYYENKGVYFNEAFTYTFTVEEENFRAEDFSTECVYTADGEGQSGANLTMPSNNNSRTYSWTVSGENGSADGIYAFNFNGHDLAGNQVVFNITEDNPYIVAEDAYEGVWKKENPEHYTTGKKVLDTLNPKVTLTGSDDVPRYYKGDGAYFNGAFTYTFTVEEENFRADDYSTECKYTADGKGKSGATLTKPSDDSTKTYSWAVSSGENGSADGIYQFTFTGQDLAGNPVVFDIAKDDKYIFAEDAYEGVWKKEDPEHYTTGKKVLDTVAPVFEKTIAKDASIKKANLEGKTAYYKTNITAKWTITDTNFDPALIGAGLIDNTQADYQTAAKAINAGKSIKWVAPGGGTNHVKDTNEYVVSTTKDGVYAFTISGKDKAGNRLVQSETEAHISTSWQKTREYRRRSGRYWTYAKVVDTIAPNGYLTIRNNRGTEYYKYAIGSGAGVNYSEPYRKGETSATVNVAVTKGHSDHSPVKINYTIKSSNSSWTRRLADSDYRYMQAKSKGTVDGAQFIQVVDIVMTDRAGNVTKVSSPNKMSLDNGVPVIDELAPIIQMTATANSSAFGPMGQPLYRTKSGGSYNALDVKLTVTDPNPNSSSSGLDSVTYEIYINGAKAFTSSELISGSGTYHNKQFNKDYSDTNPVTNLPYNISVDGNTYNYNDIKIIAYAKDRAGHTTQRELAFGIDNTEPKITVAFDNNSAQNGKYFKENRVATVTVRERNFDANGVRINTQAAAEQSGWTPHYDHSGNGDNTTWTKTITYATDGDYTLDVTARDLLGWDAGRADYGNSVAPQDFTVDKTQPRIDITFDNTNLKNTVDGVEYYAAARTATITVTEHNFGNGDIREETIEASNPDPSVNLSKPALNGWSDSGDSHYATVSCTEDGVYRITFNYTDLAGNVATQYVTAQYVVDTTKPTISWVAGSVKEKAAYPGTIAPAVEVADTFMNWEGVTFDLVGARNGKVTVTEQEMEHISDYLGRKSYNNFPVQRMYDDIYTLTAHVIDLSGNEETLPITFSVNRFGSTWDYNNDPVTLDIVDRYYINQEKPVMIREINPTLVSDWRAYISHAGEYKELTENTDFTVKTNTSGESGWNEYIYQFNAALFEEEGLYEIYVQSTDEANNPNSNGSVHGDDDENYEVVPRFIVDKTNPRSTLTDATDMTKHQYLEDEVPINIVPADNYALTRVDIYINDELRDSYYDDPENENYRLRDTLEANNNTIPWTLSSQDAAQILRVESYDAAGNRSGYSIQNEFIDDPDDPEILTWNVVVTRNVAIQYINNRIALGATGVGILLLLLLLLAKRKKDDRDKKAAA